MAQVWLEAISKPPFDRPKLLILNGLKWVLKPALVTGSSRGLGRAIVEADLAAGNKALATARDIESLRDVSKRYPDQVKLFALDVTDESAAAGAVKTAIAGFGSLDVVINNAGYGNLLPVEDTPMSKPTSLGRSS